MANQSTIVEFFNTEVSSLKTFFKPENIGNRMCPMSMGEVTPSEIPNKSYVEFYYNEIPKPSDWAYLGIVVNQQISAIEMAKMNSINEELMNELTTLRAKV